jgi:flagellar biosynthesis protein FlhB
MDIFSSLCMPAQLFLVGQSLLSGFKIIFSEKTVLERLKIFVFIFILIIGWTSLVNYACDASDNNYIAWFLVILPASLKLIRR